jgi:SAM-dependent methyltransferase
MRQAVRPTVVEDQLLDLAEWARPPDAVDDLVLRRCVGPTLDVGCGPGRMVVELVRRGIPALGIDVLAAAVRHVLVSGGLALTQSVFDRVPGEGRWPTALLVDGCVGIGGEPALLLARVRELLAPGGVVYVELDPVHGRAGRTTVWLRDLHGRVTTKVAWAVVGSRLLAQVAREVDLVVKDSWTAGGRVFAAVERPHERTGRR